MILLSKFNLLGISIISSGKNNSLSNAFDKKDMNDFVSKINNFLNFKNQNI